MDVVQALKSKKSIPKGPTVLVAVPHLAAVVTLRSNEMMLLDPIVLAMLPRSDAAEPVQSPSKTVWEATVHVRQVSTVAAATFKVALLKMMPKVPIATVSSLGTDAAPTVSQVKPVKLPRKITMVPTVLVHSHNSDVVLAQ